MTQYQLPKLYDGDLQMRPQWGALKMKNDFTFSLPVIIEQRVDLDDKADRYVFVCYDIQTHIHFSPSISETPFIETMPALSSFRLRVTCGDADDRYDGEEEETEIITDEDFIAELYVIVNIQDVATKLEADHLRKLRYYIQENLKYNMNAMRSTYAKYVGGETVLMNVFNSMFNGEE